MSSLSRGLLGVVLSFAVGVVGLPVLVEPVAAAAVMAARDVEDFTRPDSVSAMQAAQALDKRVEDESQRDPWTRVYANPDGSWTSEVTSEPESVLDPSSGDWVSVDTSLVEVPGGLAPAAAVGDVVLSDGGDRVFAALSEDGRDLGWKWTSALPEPVVDGSTATYPNVVENGDLVVTALATGFSYHIVLREAPTQPLTLRMPVATDGTVVSETTDGGVEVATKSGDVVAEAPAPVMWDSSEDVVGDPEVAPVDVSVAKTSNGNAAITLSPDQGFLTDPGTVYPVVVDPSFTTLTSADTWVQNAEWTNSMSGSDELRAGTYDSGGHVARSFLKFNISNAMGQKVTSATLRLRNWLSLSCGGSAINATRIAADWTQGSLTWANQPAVNTTGVASYTPAYGGPTGSSCQAGDDANWDVTSIVDAWASGAAPNYGLRLKAADETTNASWRRYRSLEQNTTNGTGIIPRLIITYTSYPTTAWRPVVSTNPASNAGYSRSTLPKLQAVVKDPDGGQVRAKFELYPAGATTPSWSGFSDYVSSGSTATLQMTSGMANNTTYTIKAYGNDGTLTSKTASASATVMIDASAPNTVVTATGHVNNAWTPAAPGSNTFTLNGDGDTSYFAVAKDGVPDGTVSANSSGDATLQWNPANGWHVLTVTAFDKAGNSKAAPAFGFGVGGAAMATNPPNDQASTAVFATSGSAPGGASGARMEFRITDATATWTTAPAGTVKTPAGGNWSGSVTQSNGASLTGDVAFNVRAAANLTGSKTVDVRVCFTYTGGADQCSNARRVQLVESAFGGRYPTAQVGPAQVALYTGEAMVSAPDALDAAAGAGRVFSSFDGATSIDGPFGYGWSSMITLDGGVSSASIVDNNTDTAPGGDQDRYVLQMDGWGEQTYKLDTNSVFVPEGIDDGTRLTLNTAEDKLTYTPVGGAVVSWTKNTDGEWVVDKVDPAGGGVINVLTAGSTTFVAQVAPGTSAACNLSTQAAGCRGLKITQSGGHVDKITQVVAGQADQDLVAYTYTSSKLTKVCDLTQGTTWCADYTYVTVNSRTLLATVQQPGGLKPWAFTYDTTGRLLSVTRPVDPATGSGNATWTIKYDLPLSTPGLPDLSATAAAAWGQTEVPVKAAAVWQPNRVPAASPSGADMAFAAVSWMTADGETTNTGVNSGSQWLVDTSWYDSHGNVVQTLDGAGWARVQAAAAADRQGVAIDASSFTDYNADGSRAEHEWGPVHTATLNNGMVGRYRSHTAYTYDDEGTYPGRPTPPNGQTSWDVVMQTSSSAALPDKTGVFDETIARNSYTKLGDGDVDTWDLGSPTKTEVQNSSGGWETVSLTRYNAEGQVIETRQPGGGADGTGAGTDARSTMFVYYTDAANTAFPECGGKSAWAGLECMHGPTVQPAGNPLPRTFTTTYNRDLVPLVVEDRAGGTTRTTTTTLDSKGRTSTVAVTVTGGNGSDPAMPTVTYTYDNTTGQVATQSAGGETISTTFDTWGRLKTYTDADGMPSTATFTPAGQVATVDDGLGTYTYTYGDNRGLPTSIDVGLPSGPDVFTLAYDNQGNPVTVTYPNGTVATRTFDEQGVPQTLSYANAGTPILGFTQTTDVDGRVTAQTSTGSAQDFTYDALGRLIKVNDTRDGACTTRVYGFNATSERTSKTTYGPNTNNGCQTTTPAASWTGTYDTANRVTNTGYTYDNLGRTRTTPLADVTAGEAMGALTATYYPNDMVATLSQPVDNGTGTTVTKTNTYSLDPAGRIDQITTTQAGSETQRLKYRFAGTGDSPSSIATSTNAGANWTTTRYLQIPGIGMTGNTTNSTTEWALPNLHGDTVATQPNTTGATTLATYSETDEYGAPLTNTTTGRYGYLGTHQRSADTLGGLTLMGARLYNPTAGHFSSVDSVSGGNVTRYAYPIDPVNSVDLDGRQVVYDKYKLFQCYRYNYVCKAKRAAHVVTVGTVAMGGAKKAGGTCERILGMFVCYGLPSWYILAQRAGTTYGNAFITHLLKSEITAPMMSHEKEHRHQWYIFGHWFPELYLKEGVDPCQNYFEQKAGLENGNYDC